MLPAAGASERPRRPGTAVRPGEAPPAGNGPASREPQHCPAGNGSASREPQHCPTGNGTAPSGTTGAEPAVAALVCTRCLCGNGRYRGLSGRCGSCRLREARTQGTVTFQSAQYICGFFNTSTRIVSVCLGFCPFILHSAAADNDRIHSLVENVQKG